jgi:hypothetical protein
MTRSGGGCSFFGFGISAGGCFGFSTAASGFVVSGPGCFCLVSGVGGGAIRGALLGAASSGGGTADSFFGFPGFCFGGFGATLGAVVSVAPVVGGTEVLGATFSRCLFSLLSRMGAGLVAAGTEAEGVVSGEIFSFCLFLFFSGVLAGFTEAEALGAGEILSSRLFLFLSLLGAT